MVNVSTKRQFGIRPELRNPMKESSRSKLIGAIRTLLSSGELSPGARLPSEQALEKRFGLNRHHLRIALQELKTYGIVDTRPQSGTYLAQLGMKALTTMLTNVLDLDEPDYRSLADTRTVLEMRAAELAAQNASADDITELNRIAAELRTEVENGRRGLEEDYVLHLTIARSSKSSVLISVISSIIPACLRYSESVRPPRENCLRALKENTDIVVAIAARDPGAAAAAMRTHMQNTFHATCELLNSIDSSVAST